MTSWVTVHQAHLSMGFSRQGCWSELLFPSPAGLPDPGIEPASPILAGGLLTTEPPEKPFFLLIVNFNCTDYTKVIVTLF